MAWIRNAETVVAWPAEQRYVIEFEIGTECHMPGILEYPGGFLLCTPNTMERDEKGMYRYLIHMTSFFQIPADLEKSTKEWEKADSEGYSFPGGYGEELIALLSVFFRCRFYLISTSQGEATGKGMRLKRLHRFTYIPCNPKVHPPIFTKSRNWHDGSVEYLDKLRRLPEALHRRFALACWHYLDALKEVGVNDEMVFIRLVSAIECLLPAPAELPDDPFGGKALSDFCNLALLDEPARNSITSWYEKQRHISRRFIHFVKENGKGYLATGNAGMKITIHDIEKFLKAIYSARSGYLHEGKTMYLSRLPPHDPNWDYDPGYGQIIDQRKWPADDRLPYPHFFEGLVRHCILKYLDDNSVVDVLVK
jgi:hypothetical protein